jgi:hypothetical protein
MRSPTADFLAAMKRDCEGRIKEVASESFPTDRIDVAEGQVRNMLSGQRRLTAAFVLEALSDSERTETLRFLAERAGFDLVRRRVLSEADLLEEVLAQRAELRERMERIDETLLTLAERRGPVRVPSRSDAERRRA